MIDYQAARTAMVDGQIRPSDVTRYPILEAMLNVPRESFVPSGKRPVAYMGADIDLGGDRFVLDPRVFAKMLENLEVQSNELVLDIGSGLGYSAAVIARMAEAVIAVESDADLASVAETSLSEQSVYNAVVSVGPLNAGAEEHGPYDVIMIEGGVQTIPDALLSQLKVGGRIVAIFMQGPIGQCRVGVQTENNVAWRVAFDATAPILDGFTATHEFAL